jgi:hypothetical protein
MRNARNFPAASHLRPYEAVTGGWVTSCAATSVSRGGKTTYELDLEEGNLALGFSTAFRVGPGPSAPS